MGFLHKVEAELSKVSPKQMDHARHGVEGIAFYDIPPLEFIKLTTETDAQVQHILKAAKNVGQYNEWGSSIHPFVYVRPDGKIVGHEGRHRCAAQYNSDHRALFRIVIAAKESEWPVEEYGCGGVRYR